MKFFTTTPFMLFFITLSPVWGYDLTNKVLTENQPTIKVMTLNMKGSLQNSNSLKMLAEAIKKVNPDVIALQEVVSRSYKTEYIEDMIKLFSEYTEYPYYVYRATIDSDTHGNYSSLAKGSGEQGNGILSKYPLTNMRNLILPNGEDNEPRSALVADAIVPDFPVPITIINVHLDWSENDSSRKKQIELIHTKLLSRGIRILMGDFNDVMGTEAMNQLNKYWISTIPEGMDNRTWPAVNPESGIDHIFTSKAQVWEIITEIPNNLDNNKEKIIWHELSDHIPVISELILLEQ